MHTACKRVNFLCNGALLNNIMQVPCSLTAVLLHRHLPVQYKELRLFCIAIAALECSSALCAPYANYSNLSPDSRVLDIGPSVGSLSC